MDTATASIPSAAPGDPIPPVEADEKTTNAVQNAEGKPALTSTQQVERLRREAGAPEYSAAAFAKLCRVAPEIAIPLLIAELRKPPGERRYEKQPIRSGFVHIFLTLPYATLDGLQDELRAGLRAKDGKAVLSREEAAVLAGHYGGPRLLLDVLKAADFTVDDRLNVDNMIYLLRINLDVAHSAIQQCRETAGEGAADLMLSSIRDYVDDPTSGKTINHLWPVVRPAYLRDLTDPDVRVQLTAIFQVRNETDNPQDLDAVIDAYSKLAIRAKTDRATAAAFLKKLSEGHHHIDRMQRPVSALSLLSSGRRPLSEEQMSRLAALGTVVDLRALDRNVLARTDSSPEDIAHSVTSLRLSRTPEDRDIAVSALLSLAERARTEPAAAYWLGRLCGKNGDLLSAADGTLALTAEQEARLKAVDMSFLSGSRQKERPVEKK